MEITSGLTLVTTSTTAGALEPVIDAVETLYLQIDRDTAAFAAATGLACLDGCGRCCRSLSVEATVLEMMPLARALFRGGFIDAWQDVVFQAPSSGGCIIFDPDPAVAGNGRCRLYGWRPLICRLFGFAARKDKTGRPSFKACRELAAGRPPVAATAAAAVDGGLPVPIFAAYHLQIASLHATLGSPLMPINKAFQQAVNRYGLASQIAAEAIAAPVPLEDDPHRGPEGRLPPRLAA